MNVPNFSGVHPARIQFEATICGRTRASRVCSTRPQRGAHASHRGEPHENMRTSPVSSESPQTPEGRKQANSVRALRRALCVLYCEASFRKSTATLAWGAGDVKRHPRDMGVALQFPQLRVAVGRFSHIRIK